MSPKPCREFLRKPLSKRPRNPPRVPSAERNTSPPGFFPSCHVSPNTPHREDFPRTSPEFAICLRVPSENPSSGSPPSRHVSRDSRIPPGSPNALCTRVPSEFSPDASGCATCPECARAADHPDATRQPANHPGSPSRALSECAACRSSRERIFCYL